MHNPPQGEGCHTPGRRRGIEIVPVRNFKVSRGMFFALRNSGKKLKSSREAICWELEPLRRGCGCFFDDAAGTRDCRAGFFDELRSEERRVGKECGSVL